MVSIWKQRRSLPQVGGGNRNYNSKGQRIVARGRGQMYRKKAPIRRRVVRRAPVRRAPVRRRIVRRRVAARRAPARPRLGLSPTAQAYCKVLYNPFAPGISVGVPSLLNSPSQKIRVEAHGKFYVGTGVGGNNPDGFAFLIFNPYYYVNGKDASLSAAVQNQNHWAPIWCSTPDNEFGDGMTAAQLAALRNPTTNQTTVLDISPYFMPNAGTNAWGYPDSDLTATVFKDIVNNDKYNQEDWRCVGAGVKFRYSGKLEERRGTFVIYQDHMHDGNVLAGQFGGVDLTEQYLLKSQNLSSTAAVDGGTHAITWQPRVDEDLEYTSNWIASGNPGITADDVRGISKYATCGVFVFGAPAQQAFEWHYVAHYERRGENVHSMTRTHGDLIGMNRVLDVMPAKPPLGDPAAVCASLTARAVQTPYVSANPSSESGFSATIHRNPIPPRMDDDQLMNLVEAVERDNGIPFSAGLGAAVVTVYAALFTLPIMLNYFQSGRTVNNYGTVDLGEPQDLPLVGDYSESSVWMQNPSAPQLGYDTPYRQGTVSRNLGHGHPSGSYHSRAGDLLDQQSAAAAMLAAQRQAEMSYLDDMAGLDGHEPPGNQ